MQLGLMANTGASRIVKELVFRAETHPPHAEQILPANPLTDLSDESLAAFVDGTIFEDAIPELLETGNLRAASLQRALAAAAGHAVRLDGGTQRIERVKSPLDRARELADEHADTAFGAMFAQAAQRIAPVTDHTQPMTLPPEMLEDIPSVEIEIIAEPPVRPPTLIGIVAAPQPRSRPTVKPNPRRSK